MKIIDTSLSGLKIIEPTLFGDERGFFFESFNQKIFNQAIGEEVIFVQDNHSSSAKNVLRGLHFQKEPHQQGKLVRVIAGEVFDVAVDIRSDSPTVGKWHGEYLSARNKRQIWIPKGFAHGFLVLSEQAEFLYKTTDYWHPELDVTIRWDDPEIGITWPLSHVPILSEKDRNITATLKSQIIG
jgi:dTDP-4-dehydrorhamnose 3,5-epimerase